MKTMAEIWRDRGFVAGAKMVDSTGGIVTLQGEVQKIPGGEVVHVKCDYALGNGVTGYTYTAAVCNLSPAGRDHGDDSTG